MTASLERDAESVPDSSGRNVLGRTARAQTRVGRRVAAFVAFFAFMYGWSQFAHAVGVPENPLTVSLFIWLATIAWNVELPWRHHLGFLADWWPPMVGLTIYWFTRGYTDDLGIPVHVTAPIRFDDWVGGGRTPTEILQQHWCALPCDNTVPIHWYDVLLTTVYSTHFFTGLTIAGLLWLLRRSEFRLFMRRYVAINYCALVIYFLYPMAPPWLAAQDGDLPRTVLRSSGRGWGHHVATHVDATLSGLSNPTAAMPSLHTGVATTIALYGIWRLHSRWRFLLLLYPLAMATALVYFAEHYVIDVLAGALLACLVMAVMPHYDRWRDGPRTQRSPAGPAQSGG